MKKRFYFLIAGILLVLASAIFFLLFKFNFILLGSVEGECKMILENAGADKIDMVFLTNDVSENEVQKYVNFFLASEPFASNKEKFNFYYAGESDCEIIQGKAVYCYSRDLLKQSSVCPNDFIIVLSEEATNIRSSAYMNVVSLNIKNSKTVILHEFGHVFSNLADEYVPSIIPWGAKNCQDECDDFEEFGTLEGCYIGCSKADIFRSIENSVMRTLGTDEFGEFNTMLKTEDLDK